ncbi:MAG: FAD-binding protein [Melioribacteraceae bacterium]|nr:FAD-binding protein [Melioribacteraceae bacterium]
MIKETEISIFPNKLEDKKLYKKLAAKNLKVNESEITSLQVLRRSVDARGKYPHYKIKVKVFIGEFSVDEKYEFNFKNVSKGKRVIIVGSGPAGLFAALKLLELGLKPIIIERGSDVQKRRQDLKAIQQDGIVNPNSNYCFGEGGAGTYSDGKLYTRSTKRGDVKRILNLFIQHGAKEDILIDAHPHIGSNNLPKIIQQIRNTIINHGGEIHFDSKVTDFVVDNSTIKGVIVNESLEFIGDSVILATGHSARDIYYLLDNHKIELEAKSFAMGVRVEHPQQLIDSIQYNSSKQTSNLPAAEYRLACQVDNRGVYSFCMCPGGIIIPAATEPGELVLNGMSTSQRNSPFANAGLVVTVTEDDWQHHSEKGIFAGLEFQKEVEKIAFTNGGGNQTAPAQRITDFVNNKESQTLPDTSYIPGIISSPLHEILPSGIVTRLQKSLFQFNKRMKGYYTDEAQILAAETRTSSPIRIPRDKETLMHIGVNGLFPSGEGAGYAGGIISAAIDGERSAEAVAKYLL